MLINEDLFIWDNYSIFPFSEDTEAHVNDRAFKILKKNDLKICQNVS